jgi:V8-like Glu-specific endopeptidase
LAPSAEDFEQLRKKLKAIEEESAALKEESAANAANIQALKEESAAQKEESAANIQALKEESAAQKEKLSDSLAVVPDRFMMNLKHSTVQFLNDDDEPIGIGFFVSPNIIVTAYHNIDVNRPSLVRALITSVDENIITRTYTHTFATNAIKDTKECRALDLGILTVETPHTNYLIIHSYCNLKPTRKDFAIASYSISLKSQLKESTDFLGDGFAVMPAVIYKTSDNHVVYLSNCFSGDSGGAVICSTAGEVFALHLETVNQAKEELDKDAISLQDVAESVNACIKGYSQGFLGLRLDSQKVRALIFGE